MVTAGEVLGKASELKPGRGAYVASGENTVYASLTGFRRMISSPEQSPDKRPIVEVTGHKGHGPVPEPGSIVLARVTKVMVRMAVGDIICVGPKAAREKFTGVIWQQDVRATEIDRVDMYLSFRPGDIVRALVLSLGDARAYHLSTAKNELGVISTENSAGMAYIPPHKRHSNESIKPSPPPNSVLPKSRMAHENRKDEDQKIVHPEDRIYKWFLQYSNGTEVDIPQCLQFATVSTDSYKWTTREKPLILMNGNVRNESNEVSAATGLRTPWVSVAESVEEDLLLGFERAKNRIEHGVFEALKMRLIARFGKCLFIGHPSVIIESQKDELVAESKLLGATKWLHRDLPISYMENVKYVVVPKIGLQIEEVKDRYYVMLFDKARPESSFSCKCTLGEDKRLNMYKVERNFRRNVVVDVSCLDQNLDLRLLVESMKISTAAQTDNEISYMKELIDSAVFDPNVKGGLRWPLGKASSGNRYSVCGIWHMTTTSYSNSNIRLKVREADRFDFRTATGEAAREVFLILKGISTKIQEQKGEKGLITDMLKDVLKTIWDEFLPCDPFLT